MSSTCGKILIEKLKLEGFGCAMSHSKITGRISETLQSRRRNLNKMLDLPEREQSRKRKDNPLEISSMMDFKKIKKFNVNVEFLPNTTQQPKNDDKYSYCIGVYMIKEINQQNIIEYFTKFE